MSEPRSPQAIWNELSQIVIHYSLLEWDKCAIALMQWLNTQNIPGKILKLKTKRRSDLYIVSDHIVSDRITANQSITENGTHYGVEVLGKALSRPELKVFPSETRCERANRGKSTEVD